MTAAPPHRSRRGRVLRVAVVLGAAAWVPFALAHVFDLDGIGWWVIAAQAFSLYAFALTVVALLVAGALRVWPAALVAIAGVVVLGSHLGGRVTSDPQPQATGPTVVVMMANLRLGQADPAGTVALVRKHRVDVLVVNELPWGALTRLDAAGLKAALPNRQAVPNSDVGAFSRFRTSWDDDLLPPNRPWIPAKIYLPAARGALHVEAMHAAAPRPKSMRFYARDILGAMPGPLVAGEPTIVAGDMNATLDHHRLRRLLARGYRDAAEEAGAGLRPTWRRGPFALTIDHILVPPNVAVRGVQVVPIPGSDHRAVIARLQLPG